MKVIEKNGKYFWEEEIEVECSAEFTNKTRCKNPPVRRWAENVKGPWCQSCHDMLIDNMTEDGGWKGEE